MIVYGSSLSPFVRKVLAYASEKGIDVEVKPTALGDADSDFRAASPFGKMPGFSDGDFQLADSSAIIHYLEAKQPEPNLIPTEPKARGGPHHFVAVMVTLRRSSWPAGGV